MEGEGMRYGFATSASKTSMNTMAKAIVAVQSRMVRQG